MCLLVVYNVVYIVGCKIAHASGVYGIRAKKYNPHPNFERLIGLSCLV